MGRIRIAVQRFGRRLGSLLSRPRKPGPVADVEPGADSDTAPFQPLAAVGPEGEEPAPSFRNRARLRRRLRYLRQTRELGFRDLGGFLFDSKRLGRERPDIVAAKLEGLAAIDRELRALEIALDDAQDLTLLHEPGISVCPRCGALHGSEDNYCPSCGLPVGRGLGLAIAQGGPGGAAVTAKPAVPAADTTAADAPAPDAPAPEVQTANAKTPTAETPAATPEPTQPSAGSDDEAQTSESRSVAKP